MKKVLLLLILALFVGLAACSNDTPPDVYEPAEATEPATEPTPEPQAPEEPEPSPEPEVPSPEPEEEPEPEPEPTPQGSNIHGAIHRVEYGDNVAYLFGTIHGGHPHWFPLADVVEDALRRADVIAVEIAEIEGGEAAMAEAIMSFMFLPDGQTWVDFLPEAEYDHLVATMAGWGIPYAGMNTFHPAALITSLTMEFVASMSEFDISPDASVDVYIANVAAELGIPVIGLESAEQQASIIFDPPFEVVLAQIMDFGTPDEVIEAFYESGALTLDQMAYYYEHNNFARLNSDMEYFLDVDCLYAIYFRDIVMNWRSTYYANEIARLLRETGEPTTFFVAVGASHITRSIIGEPLTDIVQEMRLMGFDVVPIY